MSDQYTAHDTIRPRRLDLFRVGVVVAAFLALVLSAAVTVGASPAATSAPETAAPTSSAGPDHGPGGRLSPDRGGPFGGLFNGLDRLGDKLPSLDGGWMGGIAELPGLTDLPDFGGFGGFGHSISITKVDGSAISLATDDGWTRTITVTDSTAIYKGSSKGTLADLQVGDKVLISEKKESDGTFAITRIVVVVPQIAGTVTAVNSGGFTVKLRDGSTKTVTVTASTTYAVGGKDATKADVTVGVRVNVQGASGSGDSFEATAVQIQPAVLGGTVTAVTADSITVKKSDGSAGTIHVDSATTFRILGISGAKVSDVTVGMMVQATGKLRSDGSLDAASVFGGSFHFRMIKPPAAAPTAAAGPST